MMMRGFTQRPAVVRAGDEVAEHRFGDFEVGDDPISEGADGADVSRRAPEHLFGFAPDGEDLVASARVALNRDDRRFAGDDPFPFT